MNEATKQAALLAALEAAPRESCGLVVETSEGERYWPCRNVSPIESDFTVSKFDYVAATKAGRIVGVVHSHPNGFPLPTQADLTKCEESGLPWHIVSPHLNRWHSFAPSGFKAPLLKREWVWGIHDCWALVRDWYAEHGVILRDFERPDDPCDFLRDPLFEPLFEEAGFREVSRESIKPGDVALLSFKSTKLNHVGVFDEDLRLLHHTQGRLSRAEIYGEGLQKSTGKVVRHLESERLRLGQ